MRLSFIAGNSRTVVDYIDFAIAESLILPDTGFKVTKCISCFDSDANVYTVYKKNADWNNYGDNREELIISMAKNGYLILDEDYEVICDDADHYDYVKCEPDSAELLDAIKDAKEKENHYQMHKDDNDVE